MFLHEKSRNDFLQNHFCLYVKIVSNYKFVNNIFTISCNVEGRKKNYMRVYKHLYIMRLMINHLYIDHK